MRNPFGPYFWRGFWLTALYEAVHSLLASRTVKQAAEKRFGTRNFNAYYRLAYNAFALPTLLLVFRDAYKHNGGLIYDLKGPKRRLAQLCFACVLAYALWAAWQIRFSRLSGFGPALKGITGGNEPDAPEGQNPSFTHGAPQSGPFAHHRHALNFIVPFIFWAWPRQTQASAGMNLAVALYCVLGSIPTDHRLREKYGDTYAKYQEQVPFLLPKLK